VTGFGATLLAVLLGALVLAARAAPAEVDASAAVMPGMRVLRGEPEAVVRALLDEKVLLMDGAGEVVRAYVLFDRPLDRVFELLADTDRQGEFRSELEDLATVAKLPDGHVDEYHIRILFVEVGYRLRYRLDPERKQIRWELDPSFENPMRRVEGSWELFAMEPTRTLGRLSTLVNVGDELPGFLQDQLTRTTLPRTLERCRRWVNADGAAP